MSLLRSLQDRCHTYARVYWTRILSKEIKANIAEMEVKHAKGHNKGKRIPWACYKACMLMALPKSTGLYELGLVLAMTRDKGETAQQWVQRLDQGRTAVGMKLEGNNLSDQCYVELLMRGLLNKEKGELIKAEVLTQAKNPYYVGAKVLVEYDGDLYRATITHNHVTLFTTYVDVRYEDCEGFDTDVETNIIQDRLTPDDDVNTHVRAMEAVRASNWPQMCE